MTTDNKNKAFFEALHNVGTSETTIPNNGYTMSVADFRNREEHCEPEGTFDGREIIAGNNENYEEALHTLKKMREDAETEEKFLLVEDLDKVIALLEMGFPVNNSSDNSTEVREYGMATLNSLLSQEAFDNLREMTENYDSLDEFLDEYLDIIAEIMEDNYNVPKEIEEQVLAYIIDEVSEYLD